MRNRKQKDITGNKYNKLTAVRFSHSVKTGTIKSHWFFRCDCGVEKTISKVNVISGHVKTCGCSRKEITIDITGRKFGRLFAIKRHHKEKDGAYYWLFKCDCGNEAIVRKANVLFGKTKSCGCLQKDTASVVGTKTKTHGMTRTRFYKIWIGILVRCNNSNSTSYSRYGGRGIRCLFTSFEHFRDTMYASYLKHCEIHGGSNTSIERINNDGNYEADNCKWSTQKWQQRNKRSSRFLTLGKERKTVAEWGEYLGINTETIHTRLNRGWDEKRVLTTPTTR